MPAVTPRKTRKAATIGGVALVAVIALVVIGFALRGSSAKPHPRATDAGCAPAATTPAPQVISGTYPAVRQTMPTLKYYGGRFIRHPQVVTITFAGDDPALVKAVEELGDVVTRGTWWKTVTEGLCAAENDCVGVGKPGVRVRLATEAPKTGTGEEWFERVTTQIAEGKIPKPNDDSVYVVYLPKGSKIDTGGGKACGFGGTRAHHSVFAYPKGEEVAKYPLALVMRCGDIDETTGTGSHEILESSTDPGLQGFRVDHTPEFESFLLNGLEAVDPCTLVTIDEHRTHTDGFIMHRAWSTKEAQAGHDPCVPHRPRDTYVNAVPARHEAKVTPLQRRDEIEWTAISEAAVPVNWAVSALELNQLQGVHRCLTLSLDRREVNNGTKFKLSVYLEDPGCVQDAVVGLISTIGTRSHMWPMLVRIRQ